MLNVIDGRKNSQFSLKGKKWSHVPRKIDLKEMKTIHGSESTIWSYLTYSLEKNELSSNKENTQKKRNISLFSATISV